MHPVEISDLYFKYQDGNENILNGINLKIESGKVTSILGLSGWAKAHYVIAFAASYRIYTTGK